MSAVTVCYILTSPMWPLDVDITQDWTSLERKLLTLLPRLGLSGYTRTSVMKINFASPLNNSESNKNRLCLFRVSQSTFADSVFIR